MSFNYQATSYSHPLLHRPYLTGWEINVGAWVYRQGLRKTQTCVDSLGILILEPGWSKLEAPATNAQSTQRTGWLSSGSAAWLPQTTASFWYRMSSGHVCIVVRSPQLVADQWPSGRKTMSSKWGKLFNYSNEFNPRVILQALPSSWS